MPDSKQTITKFVEHPKPKPKKVSPDGRKSEYLDNYYSEGFIERLFD